MSDDSRLEANSLEDSIRDSASSRSEPTTSYANALKRRASPSFEGLEDNSSRKRMKEQENFPPTEPSSDDQSVAVIQDTLADDLAQELNCPCCSEICYRPVIVSPCQHFFCGSCCVLWIRNGGSNCPACRGVSTSVTPSRPLQTIIDLLLRSYPSKQRAERERIQADDVYKAGSSLRIPTPREASPEPNLNLSADFARPCPHCPLHNAFGWRCPQPIPDPNTDPDHAWHLDDGTPPGHGYCGNCENLLASRAPTTTKCDLCQVSFCGVGVQGRCIATALQSQQPHGMSDVGDLIQSSEVYECFDSNTIEVEYLLDYVTAQRLTPKHIYREIVTHLQSQPAGFKPLIELDLFVDVHGVAAGIDPNPDAPRNRICRLCATEVLLWGLKEWWIRERQKGFLDEAVSSRKDCPDGSGCGKQKDLAHAREFNHIVPGPAGPPPRHAEQRNDVLPAELLIQDPLVNLGHDDSAMLQDIVSSSAFPIPDAAPSSSQDFRDAVDALT